MADAPMADRVPRMRHVESTSVEAVGYDAPRRMLYVRFVGSRTYVYYGVAEEVFDELLEADSKGRYVNECIKGAYAFDRL